MFFLFFGTQRFSQAGGKVPAAGDTENSRLASVSPEKPERSTTNDVLRVSDGVRTVGRSQEKQQQEHKWTENSLVRLTVRLFAYGHR